MPSHVGVVACSAEGASLCYRTICEEGTRLLGPHEHPEVSMHTWSLSKYVSCFDRGDWRAVGELMLLSARKLASIGAEFMVCPDNTIHKALPYIESESPKPWVNIADVVAAHAVERSFHRLGLLGTRWLLESEVYPDRLTARELEYVLPDRAERYELNRIIMDELVNGLFLPDSTAYIQKLIKRMKTEGCDAAALVCTELPLIIDDSNSSLPTLDSTRLLARAAVRRAVANGD